jgi:ribosome-associated translation inhibitor RaiA
MTMIIQFNTDKNVTGAVSQHDIVSSKITEDLKRYQSDISRIEVHFSDENGPKEGVKDIRCLLEARIEGKQPIAVSHQAENTTVALSGAITKLKASLDTISGRLGHN